MKKMIASFPVCFILLSGWSGQAPDLVKNDGITGPLHRAHVGEIVFLAKPLALADCRESDFLKAFELREDRDLHIRTFMGNSLTNDLHRLAPAMSAEELVRSGNYRFSFFVDGGLIYSENLTPGAGSPASKNTQTVFRVPLISAAGEDSWGRFLWNRFLMNGGEDALTAGKHVLKIEIRPYLLAPALKIGEIIAAGPVVLDVVKPSVDETAIAPQSIRPGSGWPVSNDSYDKEKIRNLNRKIAQRDFKDITSLIVIKDGRLLIEEYFNGADRTTLHDTRSVGKSFASALLGLAIRDGHIKDTSRTLGEFYELKSFAHFTPMKARVTLKHLLTMSSAFAGSDQNPDSPGNEENMYPTSDWVKFALDLPMDETKENGGQWDYFTAGVVLLGDILDKAVPCGLERFAEKELFKPLGIRRYEWSSTPQKVVNTAGGLRLTSLDFAKFGQLYKNGGLWNHTPVLPKSWVEASFHKYLKIPGQENGFYGFLFWNTTYKVNGRPLEAFYATGNGGNKIFVFADQPLVVVVTATAFGKPYAHPQVDKMMERYILPAILR